MPDRSVQKLSDAYQRISPGLAGSEVDTERDIAAIERAIEECIKDEVLADYLRKHREEVKHVSIYEFDQELYDEGIREDGREQGLEQGLEQGIQKSVEMAREFGIAEEELMVQLIQKFKLSKEKALEYLKTKGANI